MMLYSGGGQAAFLLQHFVRQHQLANVVQFGREPERGALLGRHAQSGSKSPRQDANLDFMLERPRMPQLFQAVQRVQDRGPRGVIHVASTMPMATAHFQGFGDGAFRKIEVERNPENSMKRKYRLHLERLAYDSGAANATPEANRLDAKIARYTGRAR